MAKREPSLFRRLLVLVSSVLLAGGLCLSALAWHSARDAADEAYDRLLLGAAYQIADSIVIRDGKREIELPISAFELLGLSDRDRIFYHVLDPAGHSLTGYESLRFPATDRPTERAAIVDSLYAGENVRLARVVRRFDDPHIGGEAVVLVAQTVRARRALAQSLALRSLFLAGIMGVLAIGSMIFAVRLALAPIGRLQAAIKNRDPLDLTLIDVTAPLELRPFVGEINRFIERLRGRVDLMQTFVADAAHQLRTPLTALNGQLELLSDAQVSEDGRKHLGRIRARVAQLSRLANQLLSHAMIAHRERAVATSRVDLTELTRRALNDAVPDTLEREIFVTFQSLSGQLEVTGDPVNLSEAIKNLIDNAVRHGAPSAIAVRVHREAQCAVIEIADDGPGIPADLWPKASMRFGAASSDSKGSGLGLSIAAAVAAAHRGGLPFGTASDGKFAAQLRLPIRGA